MKSQAQIETAIWANLHEYANPAEPDSACMKAFIRGKIRTFVYVLGDDISPEIIYEVERLGIMV